MKDDVPAERTLHQDPQVRVTQHGGRVYVITAHRRVSRGLLAAALEVIWSSPAWRQPWGLVLQMPPDGAYDPDIRSHEMPPDHRRAVGTAIVTSNVLHRVVIKSLGVGYRMISSFVITAHDTVDEAIVTERQLVSAAEGRRRPF